MASFKKFFREFLRIFFIRVFTAFFTGAVVIFMLSQNLAAKSDKSVEKNLKVAIA